MDTLIERAIKYLVAAEISFLPVKYKVALELCATNECLTTQKLNKSGDRLIFDFRHLSMQWKSNNRIVGLIDLASHEHFEIVRWIEIMALEANIKRPFYYENSVSNDLIDEQIAFIAVQDHSFDNMADKMELIKSVSVI